MMMMIAVVTEMTMTTMIMFIIMINQGTRRGGIERKETNVTAVQVIQLCHVLPPIIRTWGI